MFDRYIIEFIVGGIFVSIYAFSRFSSTRVDTHLPTNTRYTIALVSYIVVINFIYFFLSMAITAGITLPSMGINNAIADIRKLFSSGNQVLSAQLLVALLMTEALPRIKKLGYADRQLRILFQRLASLSSIAQNLSSKFQKEPFKLQESHVKDIEKSFRDWGFDDKDIQIEVSNRPHHVWTRISLLWTSMNRWENEAEYQTFLNSHAQEKDRLKAEFESLSVKAKYCFKLSSAAENDPEMRRALRDCTRHYMVQLKRHLQKLADFMSRGLLTVKKQNARVPAISQMGFASELNHGLSIDQLTLMFIMIFSIMLIGFGLSHWGVTPAAGEPHIPPKRFLLAIMIASLYSIGIVCAIMATWRSEQKNKDQHAWATYVVMSFVAAAVGSLVSIMVNTILNDWNLVEGFNAFLKAKWPWQILVFTNTFFTSFLLNRKSTSASDGMTKLRFIEGGITAGALMVALFIAGGFMGFHPMRFVTTGYKVLLIGFSIGYFIPTWYRGAPRHDKEHLSNMVEYAGLRS